MTTPVHMLPLSSPVPTSIKRKRVLLVDASPAKRELRADTMRKLGMEVDCAADIGEARSWWRADLYNLVLISSAENQLGQRDKFCEDVRSATPPQQLAFLVGEPEYLARSPHANGASSVTESCDSVLPEDVRAILPPVVAASLPQRWGILEASRRISSVRSISHARSQAMRERPAPTRDLEIRDSKRTAAWSQLLPELEKEEMQ
ncbi:MAG: response regulator [Acidobacteriia bacterium]|nr:response regulator [Terriglobia bacterium]